MYQQHVNMSPEHVCILGGQTGVDHCITLGTMHTWLASVTVMKNFGQSRSDGNSTLPVTSSYSRQASAHTSEAAWVLLACSAVFDVLLAASSISGDLTHSVPRFLQQHIQVHEQILQPELHTPVACKCQACISGSSMAGQSSYAIWFGVDSRFSLLVMCFCNPTCASFSDNVFTAAEDACMLQVHMLISCYKVSENRKLCKNLAAFNSRQRSELLYQSKANCLYTQHMLHVVQLTC